jgi:acyl-CoA synthetase (AMP-forming)/AMP-acid ligase II
MDRFLERTLREGRTMADCNIVSSLRQSASRLGEQVALTALENGSWRQWSFAQLAENSHCFAAACGTGGVPG